MLVKLSQNRGTENWVENDVAGRVTLPSPHEQYLILDLTKCDRSMLTGNNDFSVISRVMEARAELIIDLIALEF